MSKSKLVNWFYTLRHNGLSVEDARRVISLQLRCDRDCESVAVQCEREGHPLHGLIYTLRCESVDAYYTDLQNKIINKYDLEDGVESPFI